MNNFSTIALFSIILFLSSCSNRVVRQPESEIDRPLFLPRKNWQYDMGGGVSRIIRKKGNEHLVTYSTFRNFDIDDKTDWFPVVDFRWPAFFCEDRLELLLPVIIRYHLIKNTAVTDSVEHITGFNIAVINGVNGLAYSGYDGWQISTAHMVPMKLKLSGKLWFESNPGFYLHFYPRNTSAFKFEAFLDAPFSLGYQLAGRWSCKGTIKIVGGYFYYAPDPENSYYDKRWEYSRTACDFDILLPVETKYVFNRRWETTARITGIIYDIRNVEMRGSFWFTYTW